MARNKSSAEATAPRNLRKRELAIDPYDVPDETASPKRQRRSKPPEVVSENHEDEEADGDEIGSISEPTPRKPPGRAPKQAAAKTADVQTSTPSAQRHKTVAETPVKLNGFDTPSRQNIADRSARRKSARALIDRVISDAVSDDDAEEEDIAREIYESSEDEEADQEEQRDGEEGQEPTTPSKAPGRKRKAATARKRSPTPPRDLPPHEQYFYQNKPGLTKTSNNNLSMLDLLTHDEYFSVLRQLKDPHASSIDSLQALHAKSFPQWAFELSQGFSTCLYGYGSKRRLLQNFATYLTSKIPDRNHKIIIINGYVRTLTPRDILSSLSAALPSSSSSKLPIGGSNPTNTLQNLLSHFSSSSSLTITLLINSVDSQPLRKTPIQALLSQLASHPQIRLACTADSPDFPLLWDAGLRAAFNFVFHDCTTFAAFGPAELEVVDDVHELLGRKARRVGGKEGVAFVLRSLPENARSLFRLLVGEVLAASMDSQGGGGPDGDVDVDVASVEYRMVYNKAVEEFICSSEMAFRTLLKEFHDHQIITSHKDSIGTELLSLPFRKEELESILEELTA